MKSIQTSKLVGIYQLISRAKVILTLNDLSAIPRGPQAPEAGSNQHSKLRKSLNQGNSEKTPWQKCVTMQTLHQLM